MIHALIKTARPEHLEQFADGLLYCNSLAFLSDPKHVNEVWFDAEEALAAQFLPEYSGIIEIGRGENRPPIQIQPNELAGPVKCTTDRDLRVFCMYAVHSSAWGNPLPKHLLWDYLNHLWIKPRIHAYGRHAAIVLNNEAFVARVRNAARAQGLTPSYDGLVEYVDLKTHHGAFPVPLRGRIKHIKFSEEREYRFAFGPNTDLDIMEPIHLNVGSLRDIVKLTTWDELRKSFKLRFPHDGRHFPLVKPRRLPRKYKKRLKKP